MRITLSIILCATSISFGQRKNDFVKPFQFSVAPGFGLNGYHPGGYTNWVSINLTSGYSAANLLFEVAGISNLNTQRTSGLQIATLVNFTGANAFAGKQEKEKKEIIQKGFEANLTGAQFSGISNAVLTNVFGLQVTGGANVAKGALFGVQVSGLVNIVHKYSFGTQLAGLANVSYQSMDGVQLAGFMNYTTGELAGLQLGAFNKAGLITGKNLPSENPSGVQIGLVNVADRMNGLQIGLVNISKRSQGTRIGLLNIYNDGTLSETKDGTAIGLLNVGKLLDFSIYSNETFGLNYEIITGLRQNGRIKISARNSYVLNALIFSHLSFQQNSWGLGYGIRKMYFNRSEFPGLTESKFFGYGIEVQHVNLMPGEISKELSLLTRVKFIVGRRVAPKAFGVNWFTALSLNSYMSHYDHSISPSYSRLSSYSGGTYIEYWPGLSVGLLFH